MRSWVEAARIAAALHSRGNACAARAEARAGVVEPTAGAVAAAEVGVVLELARLHRRGRDGAPLELVLPCRRLLAVEGKQVGTHERARR